jgi:H3 lysine-79-specific histone-lysine N-methyltransferase
MARLYRDVWGYVIPRADVQRIRGTTGSDVYGEICHGALSRLLDHLELGADDVLFDLGSGTGKVVIHAALATDVGLAIGVEMSKTRHEIARSVVKKARQQGLDVSACRFRNADLLRTSLRGATVLYSCNTAFSDAFLTTMTDRIARLPLGVRFVSAVDLDPHPRLEHIDVLRLDTTWRRRLRVHIYRVVRSSRGGSLGARKMQRE